ncbi:MAG: type IV pilin protein [Pseudomonadota bacterium]
MLAHAKVTAPGGGSAGFTLIELMIVVVIIAVLAGVAVPAYQNYVVRTYRTTAQADLIGFAQAMEKEYALNYTYANAVAGDVFPDESPLDGENKRYDLQFDGVPTVTTYTLRAVPKAGSTQVGDGNLYIDHLGRKKWDRDNDGDPNEPTDLGWGR